MSLRPDPSVSAMGHDVVQRAFDMAELNIRDISLIEIYSCYPVAVTAIAEELGLTTDGSDPLSLTGGLPYFGGPGSNYATHGLAEMWSQLRKKPTSYGFLHGNGGILSKHGSGIFSCEPSIVDWSTAATAISTDSVPALEAIVHPDHGTIKSYTINYTNGEPVQAIILGETDDERRFVAHTRPEDQDVVKAMVEDDAAERRIDVIKGEGNEYALHFTLAAD
jgi:acetyl-CoA C-acetyltransferase